MKKSGLSYLSAAELGKNEKEIKEAALRLVGSLELRSHLGKNHKADGQAMSIKDFFTLLAAFLLAFSWMQYYIGIVIAY